jgi:hypothetical protein
MMDGSEHSACVKKVRSAMFRTQIHHQLNQKKEFIQGFKNKPGVEDQVFIRILPREYSGYARAFKSLCKNSEGI